MLTLSEIENISFRESRFGTRNYVCEDVDNFVDDVVETVKALQEKIAELEMKNQELAQQIKVHEDRADSVQNAIITAEMAAKSLMKETSAKAEKIISDASVKSEQVVAESQKTADNTLYESTQKARMLLDNALSNSAQYVSENNRIIEDQKVYITLLQDEVTKFREQILEMYHQHLALIEALPQRQQCEEYQKSLQENYPTEEPVTAASVIDELKEEADKAVVPKKDERQITVEVGGNSKDLPQTSGKSAGTDEEVVFNSSGLSQKFDGMKINFINQNEQSENN